MNRKNIITYADYGTIECSIIPVMKKRNLTKSQLIKQTGLHHNVIERYMTGNTARYDKDVLAKLCYVLDCTVDDILHYEEPKK